MHEDLGMMQEVECQAKAEGVNYHPRNSVAEHHLDAAAVDRIYPKPSLELMYRQNLSFVDPSELGFHIYPGFALKIPKLEDALTQPVPA